MRINDGVGLNLDLLTVLRPPFCTHSWLNWIDVVGLKEKPEDTRYIKKITSKEDLKHQECRQRTWYQLCHYLELSTRKWAGSSLPGSWEGVKSIPKAHTYNGTVGCRYLSIRTKFPFTTCRVMGIYYYPYPQRIPFY